MLGFRDPTGLPVSELVTEFRKALHRELGTETALLSEAETQTRLGLPSTAPSAIISKIDDAEGAYLQFALDTARQKFEAGLADLANAGGDVSIWESTRTARLLLGMVHLAGQGRDAGTKARSEFETILRVDPQFRPTTQSDDPLVLALFEKARAKVGRDPRGKLRVVCNPGCPQGFVWVDTAPVGKVSAGPISIPAGTYRVRVTDAQDAPRLRSFTREVTVSADVESTLEVNLPIEGSLDLAGGPAFALAADTALRAEAVRLATAKLAAGPVALLWRDGASGENLHLAVGDATGKIDRSAVIHLASPQSTGAALADLARFAATGRPVNAVIPTKPGLSGAPAAVEPQALGESGTPGKRSSWMRWGKWTTAGLAVALAAGGGVAELLRAQRSDDVDSRIAGFGGGIPSQELDGVLRDLDYVESAKGWRNGFFIGAGVAAVTSGVLFFLDREPRADLEAAPADGAANTAGGLRLVPTGLAFDF